MEKIFNFGPENVCILVKVVNHSIGKPHERNIKLDHTLYLWY